MGRLVRNGIDYSGNFSGAKTVSFNNEHSGLKSRNTQDAIDEICEISSKKFNDDVHSCTLYVSSEGLDTGTGTVDNPFKTISSALASLPDNIGNTRVSIVINSGVYKENIDIQGISGDLCFVINGTVVLNGNIRIVGCSNIWFNIENAQLSNVLTINNTDTNPINIYCSKVCFTGFKLIINTNIQKSAIICHTSLVSMDIDVTCNTCKYGISALYASVVYVALLNGKGEYAENVESGSILTTKEDNFQFTVSQFLRVNAAKL